MITVIGTNHKTAEIEIREKLAFNGQKLEEGLRELSSHPLIKEVFIISTCNRVELYFYSKEGSGQNSAAQEVINFLSKFHSVDIEQLRKSLYIINGMDAVRHLMRVASSLDSMVVGEPQILGQVKDAFEFALQRKTTGLILNTLVKKAISAAKRVRTETRIAENAVSVSYAAVELAKKIFEDLSTKTFMLLGAGEMAELAARHLISNGVKSVTVANRTYERGCELAKEFNGRAIKFEDFLKELVHTDIVICSTGASHYVITKEQMQRVAKERRHKPVFLIDISVPRNIDPAINEIDNVYLYDIDDLQGVVDSNMHLRQKEAQKAEDIINEEVEKFQKWYNSLDSVPTIVALRRKAEEIRDSELKEFFNKFPSMEEKQRQAVIQLANTIVNKLIHPPTAALKSDSDDREILIATLKKLYSLNGEED
ncbi:MAG: glutamyl-tRNA reductase [Thermodesulfovibrionales bacterium]|nr:glutamyl-tRNA reductase [Thermodesulfovibrionales bacterium]